MSEPRSTHQQIATIEAHGAALSRARLGVVLLHGRGSTAQNMFRLADQISIPDIAYLAPQASGQSWWPTSFLAPFATIEPHLASAIGMVDLCLSQLAENGITADRTVLVGFSQGACLALEYTARSSAHLRACVALSGGLIGTADDGDEPSQALYGHRPKRFDYATNKSGLDLFIGCHEQDPHIPLERVKQSAEVFRDLGADVTTKIHQGAGHSMMQSELGYLRGLLNAREES